MGMTAQLFIPGPMPGMNELIAAAKGHGGTGRGYAKMKQEWTQAVWVEAKRAKLPKFPGRLALRFQWYEKDKRRDPDNIAAGGRKLILDGLVLAGVLKGDGWRFVDCWTDSFQTTLGMYKPGCLVTITESEPTVLMGGT